MAEPAVVAYRVCHPAGETRYPIYRLVLIGVGVAIAVGLYLLISRTRLGMRIRAGESDREMIGALGVNIAKLYTVVFALGAALAGLAGALVGALQSVQVGMGEPVLILAFVVIVIGGIGSIKGALFGALLVGLSIPWDASTCRCFSKHSCRLPRPPGSVLHWLRC
ncbi:hypothetical protein HSBAA_20280 [Vreelandella sulfidaeris]|uniref:Branched-chain amino acid ABC transporter permease n=1 Tax=Vreelandella sulfidaeris TaxID=115553 RepID=A0A455U3T9_9GAMM|nr:hypothetical protein HSBAA_20280 [Halomonas sulfidaeris]